MIMTGCACGHLDRGVISRRGFIAGVVSVAVAPRKARAATPFRVDTHHHIFPRAVMDLQERLNPRWGKLETPRGIGPWSPRLMLDDMDRNGVASVVISPAGPGAWFGDASGARLICRAWNEFAAGLARDNAGRVGVFALVALPDVDGALGEIAYALDTLRLDGVAFYTSYDGKYPGEAAFAPVFTELNRRRATVFFHPLACCGAPVPGVPTNAYELPFDTTRAIASLMFSGTFTRNPDIRFIFSHGGGAMPMLAGRIEDLTRSFKPLRDNVPDGVPAQLSRLYVDTAGAFSPAAIAAMMKTLPATHVLYGSDFPYSGSAEAIAGLATSGLDANALRGVERDNALDLFPRLRT